MPWGLEHDPQLALSARYGKVALRFDLVAVNRLDPKLPLVALCSCSGRRSDVPTVKRASDHPCAHATRQGHEKAQTTERLLLSVVDDDSVRESLPDLLKEFGFAVEAFSSAEEFLASDYVDQTNCLILDIAMPGMSGPALQKELERRRRNIPIVFITAQGDDSVRPRMLETGAVDCLFKPFSATSLHDAVRAAFRN